MKNDTISSQVRIPHNPTGKTGQDLRKLVNNPLGNARPLPVERLEGASNGGSASFKVRLPNIGETGLSDAEIYHAMTYGVSA